MRKIPFMLIAFVFIALTSCTKNTAPTVNISTPEDNATVYFEEEITLSCVAMDEEDDNIIALNIVWSSDMDGELGTGSELTISTLSVNSHVITVVVTDLDGEKGEATINLNVLDNDFNFNISSPLNNGEYEQYEEITFTCAPEFTSGADIIAEDIIWSSDKDGEIGTGLSYTKSDLTANAHAITITYGEFTTTFNIVVNIDPNIAIFEEMLSRMTGSFSSANHADTSTDQYIVDVRLHMAQIWEDKNQGENIYWVYVEQAYASDLNSPYRQRIYKVMLTEDGRMYDEIYAIPNASTYLHAYNNVEIFNELSQEDLTIKDGCNVTFTWDSEANIYEGSTDGHQCFTTIPGISYITTRTTIAEDYLTSWDRGYNDAGWWVMGPDSPYIFDKVENYDFSASTSAAL